MPISYDDKRVIRPGSKKEYTPELIKEIMKCAQDVKYFARNYYTIVHPTKGEMIIDLFDFQERMLDLFQKNRFSCVIASRQIGKTTCSCIFLLWFAIFNENKTIAILANKQRTAVSIIDDMKKAYEMLPAFIKPGVEEYNNLNISFDNGTKVFASATTEDALRGESVSLLFCDEFSFVPQNIAQKFWNSNFPTLSQGGNAILVSTPNGAAGLFYDIYKGAEAGTSPFKPFKVNWWEFPGRDEKWKEDMVNSIGKIAFSQEYGCSFTGSTVTLIDGDTLAKLKGEEPPYTPTPFYSIWKKYVPGRVYGFGIDTAQGAGSDYSVINIFDITNFPSTGKYEQVALYRRNDQNIFNFAKDVLDLAHKWGDPVIICENNETGLGNILCNQLYMEDGYERVYYDVESGKYGITANSKTKKLATTYFKEDLEKGNCIIMSKIEISELGFFEEKEGSHGTFAARKGRGFNDDTVAASYWFSYLLKSRWFEDMIDEIYTNPGNKIVQEVKDEERLNEETLDTFNNIFTSDHDSGGDDFEKELWR
jgi:hypothetical protein